MKQTIDDLRQLYRDIAKKEPSIRWNKTTLRKKIFLAKQEAAYESNQQQPDQGVKNVGDIKPEFEQLAGVKDEIVDQAEQQPEPLESEKIETRGGPREGAGRPTGQTDRRAQVERIMSLDTPDLAVSLAVDGLNAGLAKLTGIGIDEKVVTTEIFKDMPQGSKSLALGLSKLLYYWFPSMEGRSNGFTLHLESLFLIFNPFVERLKRIVSQRQQLEQEADHGKSKTENIQQEDSLKTTGDKAGDHNSNAGGPGGPGVKRGHRSKPNKRRSSGPGRKTIKR